MRSICRLPILVCLLCASAHAKDNAELAKLADGVYARVVSPDGEAVANAGVVVWDQSVLVFDTHFTPEGGNSLLSAIRSVTPKPVRYVVNSHWHADHAHGNQVFASAQLIASANARRDVLNLDLPSLNRTTRITQTQMKSLRNALAKETDPEKRRSLNEQIKNREDYLQYASQLKITTPIIALDGNATIRDGKQDAHILFLGAGHTDGDIALYLPAQKIVFAGGLFFNSAIPNVQDAFMLDWIQTLGRLLQLDAEKFVPGHGPVGSKKDVENFLHYLEDLKAIVTPAVERGDSLEQITHEIKIPVEYASYRFQNLFPSNVQKMYAELKAMRLQSMPQGEESKSEQREP